MLWATPLVLNWFVKSWYVKKCSKWRFKPLDAPPHAMWSPILPLDPECPLIANVWFMRKKLAASDIPAPALISINN